MWLSIFVGKCWTNEDLCGAGYSIKPTCDLCGAPDSLSHRLFHCTHEEVETTRARFPPETRGTEC